MRDEVRQHADVEGGTSVTDMAVVGAEVAVGEDVDDGFMENDATVLIHSIVVFAAEEIEDVGFLFVSD